jgi:hypothetical protein
MRSVLSILFLLLSAGYSIAQTTAVDFTAVSCSPDQGSVNLFTELNKGQIIVLAWVMPCSGCEAGAQAADSAVKKLNQVAPGSAKLWLIDDGSPGDCAVLSAWANTQQISKDAFKFGNYNNEADENNYGGTGMPHIVVVGPDHHIYFNELNTTATGVDAAVQAAHIATGISSINNTLSFSIGPNPVGDALTITAVKPVRRLQISSLSGQVIREEVFATGVSSASVNVSQLAGGAYLVKITDADNKTGVQKIIKQ